MTRVAIVVGSLMAFTSLAGAQTPEETDRARELYVEASQAYDAQEWATCAVKFQESFALVFAPELLYNIGRCYEMWSASSAGVGHLERSILAYTRYLREVRVPSEERTELRERIEFLKEQKERLIEDIEAERRYQESLEEPSDVRPVMEVPLATEFEEPEPSGVDVISHASVPTEEYHTGFQYTWTAVSGGATVAAFLGAVVAGVLANSEYTHLSDTCGSTPSGCTEDQVSGLRGLSTATNVLFAASGALAVTTGIVFYLEASSTGEESRSAVTALVEF